MTSPAQFFEENGYYVVEKYLEPARALELGAAFRWWLQNSPANVVYDNQAPRSPAVYDYLPFVRLLSEKTVQVGELIGQPVMPTYAYARIYSKGEVLAPHTDRPECEVSLTINLFQDKPWPICFSSNGKTVMVTLEPGDAVLYKGCDNTHWREAFHGNEYIQVFTHYVKAFGKNSDRYFDRRNTKETEKPPVPRNQLADYILVVDNVVPHELCDAILKEYGKTKLWQPARVGNNVVDANARNVDMIGMSDKGNLTTKTRKALDHRVFASSKIALAEYNRRFPHSRVHEDTGYDLLRYKTGQYYVQHVDSFLGQPRAISCSFALNEDYEGGEFAFFDRSIQVKLKKGSAIMFPSNFMYPHEIMPVTSGVRHSIITWFR